MTQIRVTHTASQSPQMKHPVFSCEWGDTQKISSYLDHISPHTSITHTKKGFRVTLPSSHEFWANQLQMGAPSDLQRQWGASNHVWLEESRLNVLFSDSSLWLPLLSPLLLEQGTSLAEQTQSKHWKASEFCSHRFVWLSVLCLSSVSCFKWGSPKTSSL